jgi:hypothetical protein
MGLDVRIPVGLMFAVMGVLLVGYGLVGDQSVYTRSLGINVNAIWGGVMLATGAVLLALSRRSLSKPAAVDDDDRS